MSTLRQFASRYAPQLALLAVLVVSRLVMRAMGVEPNPATVMDHWQHIDLRFLAADPIGSLWTLHTQPPLWNVVLAGVVAFAGPDAATVTNVMLALNILLTAGMALLMTPVLRTIGFSVIGATLFVGVAICSPNVFYFENYAFYPHFTAFLVTLLLWLLIRVKRDGALWPVAGAIGVMLALALTWAIFHPAFVALGSAALIVQHRGWSLKKASKPLIAIAAAATMISALPTIKNYLTYGIPSASTWIGLNLAQTIPGGQSGEFVQCDFATAQREGVAAYPGLPTDPPLLTQVWKRPGEANFAHAGMIETSKRCFEMIKQVILRDPLGWLSFRMVTLSGTHQLAPANYNADPLGWDGVFGPLENVPGLDLPGRMFMTFWYLLLVWFAVKRIPSNPPLYLSLLGIVVYFTLASHLLNGGEQARMRYTIEPIYLFFCAGLLEAATRRFAPLIKPLQSMRGWAPKES